jgi:hypothetical protein
MDRVSHECKDTFAAIVNNNNSINNNGKTTTTTTNGCAKAVEDQEKHRSLFHKLEVNFEKNVYFVELQSNLCATTTLETQIVAVVDRWSLFSGESLNFVVKMVVVTSVLI